MKRFCLLGVFLVLAGCMSKVQDAVSDKEEEAKKETELIFEIRSHQATYEAYLQRRLDACKAQARILVRDSDGILVCITPPKKTEENK